MVLARPTWKPMNPNPQCKEFPLFMKKVVALFLSFAMLLIFTACMPEVENQESTEFAVPLDDASYVLQEPADATPLPGGATIALAADGSGMESGAESLL